MRQRIRFQRADLGGLEIPATVTHLGGIQYQTGLTREAVSVETVEHLLSAYGGMSSINDLLIHPANGHKIQEADVAKVNDELRSLLSKVFALSKKLYAEEANTSRRA